MGFSITIFKTWPSWHWAVMRYTLTASKDYSHLFWCYVEIGTLRPRIGTVTVRRHQESAFIMTDSILSASHYLILDYYSFIIFPQFWLVKSTRIIHHNHLLMAKFGRILCLTRKWRQKCSLLQVNAPLTEKTWGRGWVVFGVKNKMADTSLVSRARTTAGTRRSNA